MRKNIFEIQVPVCEIQQMGCVQSVEVELSKCVKPCSGMVIASFAKSRNVDLHNMMSKVLSDYNNFTKWKGFPNELKGTNEMIETHIMIYDD